MILQLYVPGKLRAKNFKSLNILNKKLVTFKGLGSYTVSGEVERVEAALKQSMYAAYFDDCKSALHRLLTERLRKAAELYYIYSVSWRPGTRYQMYALKLKPNQIHLGELGEKVEITQ